MLRTEELRKRIAFVQEFLMEEYKQTHPEKKRDWRTQEQQLAYKIKEAIRNIEPELTLKQKVILLLLKELFDRSNRNMASMLDLFCLLSEIDVSYKTIERLYSDPEVEMALHNLHILILKKKGVNSIDASGDGTGYSLTIKKNYADECSKRKDKLKENSKDKKGRRLFVYSFKILDLATWLYVAFGVSFKSEKNAFDKAYEMLSETGVSLDSIRLDKYYSSSSFVKSLKDTKVYIYFKRENSESSFAQDKKWTGWKVEQRRPDRIDTAIFCSNLWHNLFNMYRC